jgi:flavin reductase (DIM6/NTAB) family NADH-FMN oxidoreductase RutF
MEYVNVSYTTYLHETLSLLADPGVLLVAAGVDGKPNGMTIGWGAVGIIWGRPIFTVAVRPSRYTYKVMNESDSFTVCVPAEAHYNAIDFCGTKSGRDYDKFAECDMQPLPSTKVRAPGVAGWPVIYECQIVHTNEVVPANLAPAIKAVAYPNGDFHRIYYGEILATRALPDAGKLLKA